ncbi:hypothetical protein Jiend_29500 [Micromonospora endophytica]|nr:hypothetical protein Jiend_29500 [Micromonospora endophytica]
MQGQGELGADQAVDQCLADRGLLGQLGAGSTGPMLPPGHLGQHHPGTRPRRPAHTLLGTGQGRPRYALLGTGRGRLGSMLLTGRRERFGTAGCRHWILGGHPGSLVRSP